MEKENTNDGQNSVDSASRIPSCIAAKINRHFAVGRFLKSTSVYKLLPKCLSI